MRLPWPVLFAYAVVTNWFVTIPFALALTCTAWLASPWLGELRWGLFAAAAVLALPFPATAALYLYQSYDATKYWRTLKTAETIAGFSLPAGSRIQFADKAHSIIVLIELPHVTEILGMRFAGTLNPWKRQGNDVTHWGGDLHGYQIIDGLPCKGGPYANDKFGGVLFDKAGTLHRLTLGAPHELLGLKLPADTTVRRGNEREPWSFLLSQVGAYIPVLDAIAPGGVTLHVGNDGRLVRIGSGHGQTIAVQGVPLNSKNFELRDGIVISQLAEPFAIGGEMRPAGTVVQIGLDTRQTTVISE